MTKCYLSATRNHFLYIKDKCVSADIQFSFRGNTQLNLFDFNENYKPRTQSLNRMYLWTRSIDQIYWFKWGNNELAFVCSNKTVKDAKEVSLKKKQHKNAFYSIISGGNTQDQNK